MGKQFPADEKARIVVLGLKNEGKISEICREHGVQPTRSPGGRRRSCNRPVRA